jgi:phage regulator Rha-like protein
MSSVEIAELCETRHNQVVDTIARLFEKGVLRESRKTTRRVQPQGGGRPTEVYDLTKRDSLVVVSGYDDVLRARIIDRWMQIEGGGRTLSPAEMFLQNAQAMVAIERKQAVIEGKVDKIEAAQTVLSSRPANAEAITHIRKRIGKEFGLSAVVIDQVMRQTQLGPKPAGMVRNENPEADGATYAVYWRKDVTSTFKLFASQCEPATATMWTHPLVEGRFRMNGRAA